MGRAEERSSKSCTHTSDCEVVGYDEWDGRMGMCCLEIRKRLL